MQYAREIAILLYDYLNLPAKLTKAKKRKTVHIKILCNIYYRRELMQRCNVKREM